MVVVRLLAFDPVDVGYHAWCSFFLEPRFPTRWRWRTRRLTLELGCAVSRTGGGRMEHGNRSSDQSEIRRIFACYVAQSVIGEVYPRRGLEFRQPRICDWNQWCDRHICVSLQIGRVRSAGSVLI
jgi:hypothetical protein